MSYIKKYSIFVLGFFCCISFLSLRVYAQPSGPNLSSGTNPIFSFGGELTISSSATVATAPSSQKMIITDITAGVAQQDRHCEGSFVTEISNGSGTTLGKLVFTTGHLYNATSPLSHVSFQSGIPIEAGDTLHLSLSSSYRYCGTGSYTLHYTISGYYAQP